MRTTGLVLSVAMTLCTGTLSARAHGGCGGGCFYWPFWAFGIGLAAAYSCQAYSVSRSQPVYTYVPPACVYSPPAGEAAPAAVAPALQATALTAVWVPSTPGTGKWVPDPKPYSLKPRVAVAAAAAPATSTVIVTNSPEGVPLHIVSVYVTTMPPER
jgi:hypothetical protein